LLIKQTRTQNLCVLWKPVRGMLRWNGANCIITNGRHSYDGHFKPVISVQYHSTLFVNPQCTLKQQHKTLI